MADDRFDGLFGGEEELGTEDVDVPSQDGPDLFGMEPDELILPTEPNPIDDPETDVELDEMDEIPIDPDEVDSEAEDEEVALVEVVGSRTPPRDAAPPAGRVIDRPETPLALYRRYRPETFAEVIGQEHVTEPLQRALQNNRVSHAYLFSGPRGCGKTTSARILARCLNCEQGPTPTPCGVCASCRGLARGGSGSIDVIEIDAASHGGVDEARDLRERAFFAPVASRYKIYIIDEAHMVTPQGFNALLKVVEEPPPHVKFIFATTEPEKVIGTIRSRTHHYPFRLVPPKTLAAYLAKLCEAEGVRVHPSVLPLVVRAGAGSVRDSLSVLDQLLGGAADVGVTYEQAARLLGYTPEGMLDEMMDAFAAGDAQAVFASVDKVIEVGQDPRRFAEDLLRRLRDLIIVAAVPDALTTGLVDVSGDQAERLATQAAGLGPGELTRAAEVIAKGLTEMRGTTAPRLHLELMCARVLLPGADADGRGVHARLDRIERRLNMAETNMAETAVTNAPTSGDASAPVPGVADAGADAVRAPRPRSEPEPAGRAQRTPTAPGGDRRSPGPGDQGALRDQGAVRGQGPIRDQAAMDWRGSERRPEPDIPEPPLEEPPPDPWDLPPDPGELRSRPARPPGEAGRGARARGARSSAAGHRDPASAPAGAAPTHTGPAGARSRGERPPGSPPPASAPPPSPPPGSAPPPSPSPAGPPAGGRAADPGQVTVTQVRSMWPQVLDAVKLRRRVTWIILRENAQVHGFESGVLTLVLNNAGARDTFGRGGSVDILREALREVLGIQPRVELVTQSELQARGATGPDAQVAAPAPQASGVGARRPETPTAQPAPQPEDEDEGSRDDPDVDEEPLGTEELLTTMLGAELIGEEPTDS